MGTLWYQVDLENGTADVDIICDGTNIGLRHETDERCVICKKAYALADWSSWLCGKALHVKYGNKCGDRCRWALLYGAGGNL